MERWNEEAFSGRELLRPGRWCVAFLADWCPFCRSFRPMFEAADGAADISLAIADVTSEDSPLWDTFRIEVVPTIALFQDGKLIARRDGRPMQGLERTDLENLCRTAASPATSAASRAG
ncbi:MAG: thioredoxin family protein [Thermoplasmatales archaeon]|nr:thioredoxin family protein [Thermoplasmatales archaeon]